MSPRELLEETIEAHGGRERWRAVRTIEFALSSGGLAFLSRSQPKPIMSNDALDASRTAGVDVFR